MRMRVGSGQTVEFSTGFKFFTLFIINDTVKTVAIKSILESW